MVEEPVAASVAAGRGACRWLPLFRRLGRGAPLGALHFPTHLAHSSFLQHCKSACVAACRRHGEQPALTGRPAADKLLCAEIRLRQCFDGIFNAQTGMK